jgi:hypothetical protein
MSSNSNLLKRFAVLVEPRRNSIQTGIIIGHDFGASHHFVLFLSESIDRNMPIFTPKYKSVLHKKHHYSIATLLLNHVSTHLVLGILEGYNEYFKTFLHTFWKAVDTQKAVNQYFTILACAPTDLEDYTPIPIVLDLQLQKGALFDLATMEQHMENPSIFWDEEDKLYRSLRGSLVLDTDGNGVGVITHIRRTEKKAEVHFFSEDTIRQFHEVLYKPEIIYKEFEKWTLEDKIVEHHEDLLDLMTQQPNNPFHAKLELAKLAAAFKYQRTAFYKQLNIFLTDAYIHDYNCFMTEMENAQESVKTKQTKNFITFLYLILIKRAYGERLQQTAYENTQNIIEKLLDELETALNKKLHSENPKISQTGIDLILHEEDCDEEWNLLVNDLLSNSDFEIEALIFLWCIKFRQDWTQNSWAFLKEKANTHPALKQWIREKPRFKKFPNMNTTDREYFINFIQDLTKLQKIQQKIQEKKEKQDISLFATTAFYRFLHYIPKY